MQPLTLSDWPRAIVHLDGDAFFASVEQAINPALRGKPVVTGAERGIITAASYEAKAYGVQRGMRLGDATAACPQLIMLRSNYAAYRQYSQQMFAIMRRFTPDVEEYSIDEGFADLTGIRRLAPGDGYQGIAKRMQEAIIRELGITVSAGVSLTKTLAKLASNARKPHGFLALPGTSIHTLLAGTPIDAVWGIGPSTAALLRKLGYRTALAFARAPRYDIEATCGKLGLDRWFELRGELRFAVNPAPRTEFQSITRSRTFSPSPQSTFILGELFHNLEAAFTKARHYHLATSELTIWLKRQNFSLQHATIRMPRGTDSPLECAGAVRNAFAQLLTPRTTYRTTGVTLQALKPTQTVQPSLFEDSRRMERSTTVMRSVDDLNHRFGRGTVQLAVSA